MGLISSLIFLFPWIATFPTEISGPMLFSLHRDETEKAFTLYNHYVQNEGHGHDFDLLQQAAKSILYKGVSLEDPEIQFMCMLGAGIAHSKDLLPILAKGINSVDARTQLVALNYLGNQQDDEADLILIQALSSPFLIVRLEALLLLAKKNHPIVLEHLSALMVKVPPAARSLFAQIAVQLEGMEAVRLLQKLLNDEQVVVCTETLLALAENDREDFLPFIRRFIKNTSIAQQEAALFALGKLKDYHSLAHLQECMSSKQDVLKLITAYSLIQLGEKEHVHFLECEAKKGSLFAITLLGNLGEGQETLSSLLHHSDRDVRLNVVLALLKFPDACVLPHLSEFLIEEGRDFGFWPTSSCGGAIRCWKMISSATQQEKKFPSIKEHTFSIREDILVQCIEFHEKDFLNIGSILIEKNQNTLLPLFFKLLENKKSEAIIDFLKKGHQKTGAPLVRHYCALSLYRLREEGSYEEELIGWVKQRSSEQLIRFQEKNSAPSLFKPLHTFTPDDTFRFLLEVYETLVITRNPSGIELLIHAIAYGNPKNRYALSGLLLRTTE